MDRELVAELVRVTVSTRVGGVPVSVSVVAPSVDEVDRVSLVEVLLARVAERLMVEWSSGPSFGPVCRSCGGSGTDDLFGEPCGCLR